MSDNTSNTNLLGLETKFIKRQFFAPRLFDLSEHGPMLTYLVPVFVFAPLEGTCLVISLSWTLNR